ncbi:MAG: glycosyltransferase [Firmicutes bacterium]|nr:glycosyltransferase [Bacillota bacterium]
MKKLLARFLPASARAFHSNSAEQSKMIGKVLFAVKQLLKTFNKQDRKIYNLTKIIKEQNKTINNLSKLLELQNEKIDKIDLRSKNTNNKINAMQPHIRKVAYFKDYNYVKNLNPSEYRRVLEEYFETRKGYALDLNNPQTYDEKIQWLKLYGNTPLKTKLADKYAVREWVANKIGEQYLIPLLGVYENFDEINFTTLPNKFALKCTHGAGYNLIVEDKYEIDYKTARQLFDEWLNTNFAFHNGGLQLHYKDIPPKIIAEEFIKTEEDLADYKFVCFNGKIEFIWVYTQRPNMFFDCFDTNWNHKNLEREYKNAPVQPKRPNNLEEMLRIATVLCQGFIHVRVDLYETNSKIYFGEMTFTPTSGIHKFDDPNFNYELGQFINLKNTEGLQ